jgi:ribosomal protein S18 acetylase RimI-like enzyme
MMSVQIRPASEKDGEALGRMGAALARQHHEFDPRRFWLPDHLEPGYRSWLLREAKSRDAVVLIADREGEVVGYAYGRLEARDWNKLLDRHGGFHDLWVEPHARTAGVGKALAEALCERLIGLGAPRVLLMSASPNTAAQRLFARLGFRSTMVEMTREA